MADDDQNNTLLTYEFYERFHEAIAQRALAMRFSSGGPTVARSIDRLRIEAEAELYAYLLKAIERFPRAERTDGEGTPVAFYCEHRHQCKWQCLALHQGLGWGRIENTLSAWREWHRRECGGRLIHLFNGQDVTGLDKGKEAGR